MSKRLFIAALPLVLGVISGCAKSGQIDSTGGISVVRSACPVVAVPVGTGDITVFNPPASREARAIDVTASITNVRSTCNDTGTDIVAAVTFEVRAARANGSGAREVVIPYFSTVVQGGTAVVAKRISRVTIRFADGQTRASGTASAGGSIARAAATLPPEVRERLTRRRKPGDEDAATDPLSAPDIRQAVLRASFEVLVGFQLTDAQLQYNVTR